MSPKGNDNMKQDQTNTPTTPAEPVKDSLASPSGSEDVRRYTVDEIKQYASSFLKPAMCGDDAQDGGPVENRQLWLMLGCIDYPTGQGTIEDFLSQNVESTREGRQKT